MIVASIGTTHPWNIAGVGLDARVCADLGMRHVAAIAAVSVQDTAGVHGTQAIDPAVLRAQLRALPAGVGAYCVGALPDARSVREVVAFLRRRLADAEAVVDPVFAATLGGALADDGARDALREELATLPVVLTPNLGEARTLLGERIETAHAMVDAAERLRARGARAVVLKGGHLAGDPVDVLATQAGIEVFRDTRLPGSMRGGGGVLAAALACELARGRTVLESAMAARAYVREKIAARITFGGLQVAFA